MNNGMNVSIQEPHWFIKLISPKLAYDHPVTVFVNWLLAIVLLACAFCCFMPLWHVVMASISDGQAVLAHDGLLWGPTGKATLNGYKLVFADSSVIRGYLNTLTYVVGATGFGLIINVTGGYVISRESKLRVPLTLFVMLTMMFGGGLIPTYITIRNLGFVGTRWSLLIPGCTNAFFLVIMMNAFRRVPASTVEAARIDGAGHLRTLFMVMLPQAISMMVVVIVNSVVMQWNSWFNASIYVTNKRDFWPLQLWIKQIVAENSSILQNANPNYDRWLIQYVVIVIATLPIIAVFPFFQEKLEKGMIMGGVKE